MSISWQRLQYRILSTKKMNNNILDEAEKHTGPRTCPECGHQFPFWEFVSRYLRSYGLSKWLCQNCREPLECDFIKIQVYWLLGLIPFGFMFVYLMSNADLGSLNFIYLIPFFAFVLFTLYYAKFTKQEISPTSS